MSLALKTTMDDLAAAVQTVLATGKKAYAYPAEGVVQGDAVVSYPSEPIVIADTFRRGADRATFSVFRICGMPQDPLTVAEVAAAMDDSGSVITAIEGYAGGWDSVAVVTVQVDLFEPINQPAQLALRFDCDVIA